MKQYKVKSKGSFASKFVLITMLGCFSSFSVANAEPLYSKGDWLFGLNAAKVFTNETLDSISAGGAPIPGAGVNITDDTTLSFDVSYFLNSSVALNFFGGLPALIRLSFSFSSLSICSFSHCSNSPIFWCSSAFCASASRSASASMRTPVEAAWGDALAPGPASQETGPLVNL